MRIEHENWVNSTSECEICAQFDLINDFNHATHEATNNNQLSPKSLTFIVIKIYLYDSLSKFNFLRKFETKFEAFPKMLILL